MTFVVAHPSVDNLVLILTWNSIGRFPTASDPPSPPGSGRGPRRGVPSYRPPRNLDHSELQALLAKVSAGGGRGAGRHQAGRSFASRLSLHAFAHNRRLIRRRGRRRDRTGAESADRPNDRSGGSGREAGGGGRQLPRASVPYVAPLGRQEPARCGRSEDWEAICLSHSELVKPMQRLDRVGSRASWPKFLAYIGSVTDRHFHCAQFHGCKPSRRGGKSGRAKCMRPGLVAREN
jgi:hypothetical protein